LNKWKSLGEKYAVLNRTVCLADRGKLRSCFKYLKLFLTASFQITVSKECEREQAIVWRGAPKDLDALYWKGNEFI